jgi:hypothetical protein
VLFSPCMLSFVNAVTPGAFLSFLFSPYRVSGANPFFSALCNSRTASVAVGSSEHVWVACVKSSSAGRSPDYRSQRRGRCTTSLLPLSTSCSSLVHVGKGNISKENTIIIIRTVRWLFSALFSLRLWLRAGRHIHVIRGSFPLQ